MIAGPRKAAPTSASGDFRLELPIQWRGRHPEWIGDYRILDVLGTGGFGTVYLSEQTQPVQRLVAIKLLDERFRATPAESRFQAECQALAQMNHPGIAHLYAAGVTQEDQSFLVMEHIDGCDILEYCDQHRLPLAARLELFCQVCEAVQHAHHKAFIHRDLKPSNILVQEADPAPQPKVIDFGIAKHLDQPISDTTRSQGVVGSPLYISPETILAAEGADMVPDTRVDIYGLGMVLYKLLVGAQPLENLGTKMVTVVQKILNGHHPAPSRLLSSLPPEQQVELASLRGGLSPAALGRRLHGDLDWIISRAIHLDREQRYSSALDLAADLRRYLRDEPVLAGPPSLRYRLGKLLRRHRWATAATVLVLLLLLAAAAGILRENQRANAEAARARAEAATAEAVSTFLDDLLRQTDPARRQGDTIRGLLDRGAEQIRFQLENQPEARARLLLTMGRAYSQLQLSEEADAMLEEALTLSRNIYGEGSPQEAAVLRALGALRYRQGQEPEAERLLLRALEVQRQALGNEHPEVVETLSTLVELTGSGNQLEQAEHYLQQALQIQDLHPEIHPRYHAVNLMRLGSLRGAQGEVEEALGHLLRARDLVVELYGPDHLLVSDALSAACQALGRLQRPEEALEACQRSLDIRSAQLGPNHVKTSQSQFNLAALHINQQRFNEAEPLLRAALQTRSNAFGPRHPRTLAVEHALAFVLAQARKWEQAVDVYERLLAAQRDSLPPDHPERLATLSEYEDLLWQLGRERPKM